MTKKKARKGGERRDRMHELTERIAAALEAGVAPWVKPWRVPMPQNAVSGRRYQGANVVLLWIAMEDAMHADARWLTFKQAKQEGGHVRKGERGTPVVFWRFVHKQETNAETGELEDRSFGVCRTFTVFNVAQCDGLEHLAPASARAAAAPGVAERLAAHVGAKVTVGGTVAGYAPKADRIRMPARHHFEAPERHEAVLLHELVHWTGHESRLGREFGERFGEDAYAFEELVAELGAAFLASELGLEGQLRHTEYLAHWAKVLRADRYALFTASRLAQDAAEHLLEGFDA